MITTLLVQKNEKSRLEALEMKAQLDVMEKLLKAAAPTVSTVEEMDLDQARQTKKDIFLVLLLVSTGTVQIPAITVKRRMMKRSCLLTLGSIRTARKPRCPTGKEN